MQFASQFALQWVRGEGAKSVLVRGRGGARGRGVRHAGQWCGHWCSRHACGVDGDGVGDGVGDGAGDGVSVDGVDVVHMSHACFVVTTLASENVMRKLSTATVLTVWSTVSTSHAMLHACFVVTTFASAFVMHAASSAMVPATVSATATATTVFTPPLTTQLLPNCYPCHVPTASSNPIIIG